MTTYPELKKRYIDTGKVRFIFREFPLDQLAMAAFLLARCAGPDKYFPMIETLFQQQKVWVTQKPLRAAPGDRQAGRHERAGLQRMPAGQEHHRRHRGRAAAGDQAQRPVDAHLLRQRQAAAGVFSLEDFEKAMAPYLKG